MPSCYGDVAKSLEGVSPADMSSAVFHSCPVLEMGKAEFHVTMAEYSKWDIAVYLDLSTAIYRHFYFIPFRGCLLCPISKHRSLSNKKQNCLSFKL